MNRACAPIYPADAAAMLPRRYLDAARYSDVRPSGAAHRHGGYADLGRALRILKFGPLEDEAH
jgi:hypothetical protein